MSISKNEADITPPDFDSEAYMDSVVDTDENGNYPGEAEDRGTARDRLVDAMEEERADREYQLSKYSEQELKDELKRRAPF